MRPDPINIEHLLENGMSAFNQSMFTDALEYYQQAVQASTTQRQQQASRLATIKTLALMKQHANVITACDEALNIIEDPEARYACLIQKGDALCRLEQYAAALETYASTLEIEPASDWRYALLHNNAHIFLLNGEFERALSVYSRIPPTNPNEFMIRLIRLSLLVYLKRYDEALALSQKIQDIALCMRSKEFYLRTAIDNAPLSSIDPMGILYQVQKTVPEFPSPAEATLFCCYLMYYHLPNPKDFTSLTYTHSAAPDTSDKVFPDAVWHIDYEERLGKGASGAVCRGKIGSTDVAVKYMTAEAFSPEMRAVLDNEAGILETLNHPNIIQLIGVRFQPRRGFYCLAMELMAKENLYDLLQNAGKSLDQNILLSILEDIGAAVDYLHGQDIIHRDIKPQNILLSGNFRVKLADFGSAHRFRPGTVDVTLAHGATPRYKAPESSKNQIYSKQSDIYSTGIVLCALMLRKTPEQFDAQNWQSHVSDDYPDEMFLLVTNCQNDLSEKRPSSSEVYACIKACRAGFFAAPTKRPIQVPLVKEITPGKLPMLTGQEQLLGVWKNWNNGERDLEVLKAELRALSASGIDLNAPVNADGETLMHLAAYEDNASDILAMSNLMQFDLRANDGKTPVYLAARFGCVNAIEAFATLGVNVDESIVLRGAKRYTPIYVAAYNGHAKAVRTLLGLKANPDTPCDGKIPITVAMTKGHTDVVAVLKR
jgi:serine/threonine protein kinase